MLKREAITDKVLVLGIDGMDPRLTRKFVDEGKMPNVAEYIRRGACRHDLVMLGSNPTITPPQWTTLACGCHAYAHGITGYYRNGKELSQHAYNLDSRLCQAEQVWNCFAEAGKKTLVFHWPGSAWPPTSDSPNLFVVDGASPGPVNMAVAQVDHGFILQAAEPIKEVKKVKGAADFSVTMCLMEDLDVSDETENIMDLSDFLDVSKDSAYIMWKEEQATWQFTEDKPDLVQSPLKPAIGWDAAPADAKEFTILLSNGLVRRVGLLLKNEEGQYDRVAIYKNKKSQEPMAICPLGEYVEVIDEAIKADKKYEQVNREIKLLRVGENGESITMYISAGNDVTNDTVWHPTRLYKQVTENVGYPIPNVDHGTQSDLLISEVMIPNWTRTADWHAGAILQLIKDEDLDAVFSHFHNVDLEMHKFIKHMSDRPSYNRNPVEVAYKWAEQVYVQTDYYLGKFLHLLDEGWTIMITSDHGQVAPKHDVPMIFDAAGCVTVAMEKFGYTVLKRDENGERIGEIDWTKTTAIMQREGHVYLNIKGRDKHTMPDGTVIDGIVDPEDAYDLEERIMTDLYSLRDEKTGYRLIACALRNRECVHFGQGGPLAGDIFAFLAEGFNNDHGDGLSTTWGEGETSLSPIFIAAGKGIKEGFETDRVIRQIDMAPTAAILGGVRMPAQCEGAPAYQIFADEV